jgi:nucleoside-diphosphate kinase
MLLRGESLSQGTLVLVKPGKPGFGPVAEFITPGPTVALAAEAEPAAAAVPAHAGATGQAETPPGTIRGGCGPELRQNVVHGSDALDTPEREFKIFFPELV